MADLQLKEVQDFLSGELQVLTKNFSTEREKDQATFDQKMIDGMAKLETEIKSKFEGVQKDFDKALTDINEKAQKQLPSQRKNFGWSLKETLSENIDQLKAATAAGKVNGMTFNMKDFNYSDFTGYEDFATDFRQPILQKYEQFHYRNLLPAGSTTKEFLKYPKETTQVGGADVWAYGTGEGGANEAKPELEPKLITYQSDVEWLAAIIKGIPISMLEDIEWMTSFLQNKGRRDLLKREDEYIQAILTDAANSEDYNGTKTNIVDMIIDAGFRQLKNNLHMPTANVLSNADYVNILLNQASGSGEYDLPAVSTVNAQTGVLQLVGVPTFGHSYFSQGTGLVGDFNQAQLVTRQAPRLRFFDQNEDDAEKNVVMMRIEERVAVPVLYDDAMIVISPDS